MVLKSVLKILRNAAFIIVALLAILVIVINLPSVQNYMSQKAAKMLSQKLETKVTVRGVHFSLFNRVSLTQLYIEDHARDTLLYAGSLRVRMTDLFFNGPQKRIHYLELKNAKVYLYRSGQKNEWNYDFIVKALSSKKKKKKKPATFQLVLNKLDLQNIRFTLEDQWKGSDIIGSIGDLSVKAAAINTKNKVIQLSFFKANQLGLVIKSYAGTHPTKPTEVIDTTMFNVNHWRMSLADFQLSNSHFQLKGHPGIPVPNEFDADHLKITGINTKINNLSLLGDTLTGHIQQLSAKERSGLTIKSMTADVKVSPVISEVKHLSLQTSNSHISDYFAMHYDRFPDFKDYVKKVKMTADLKNSDIGIQDIAYFAPALSSYKNITVATSGKASGTVNRLTAENLKLDDGFSQVQGDLIINGLPDINHTFIDFSRVKLHTSGTAFLVYAPKLKQQNTVQFQNLTSVDFEGSLTGFFRNFVTYGNIKTNLGNIKADLKLQFPKNTAIKYTGKISTTHFATGKLLNQNTIGKTSFSVAVNGHGVKPENLLAHLEGKISELDFNHYKYSGITVNGTLEKQLFKGALSVADPNANFDFDGQINFKPKRPLYHFFANIKNINFNPLHFTKDSIRLAAGLQINMRGSDIDNFSGSAYLVKVHLFKNGKRINLRRLNLHSLISENGFHEIYLTNAQKDSFFIKGQFNPSDVFSNASLFMSYYLPAYIPTPNKLGRSHTLQFGLKAGNISGLLSLLNPRLNLKGTADINGNFNFLRQSLTLQGEIKELSWGKIVSKTTTINGKGNFNGLNIDITAHQIQADSETLISTLNLNSKVFLDTVKFQLKTISPSSLGQAQLNGIAFAQSDSLYFNLSPSHISFDKTDWHIPDNNQIILSKHYLSVRNLFFRAGQQEVAINPNGDFLKGNNVKIKLSHINIYPLSHFVNMKDFNLTGTLGGTIIGHRLLDTSTFTFDCFIQDMAINKDSLGYLKLKGGYDFSQGQIRIANGSGIQNENSSLNVSGIINTNRTNHKQPLINGHIHLKKAHLSWASPFLNGIVHDITGNITGQIDIAGQLGRPHTTGNAHLSAVSFVPNMTGVRYHIPSGNIAVKTNNFIIDSMRLLDDEGKAGMLWGNITHKNFKDFYFNLTAKGEDLKVIHQNQYQNKVFYGDIDAKVNMSLRGYIDDLSMRVTATPKGRSNLFIVVSNTSDIGNYNFISFKQRSGNDFKPNKKAENKFNFILDALIKPNLKTTLLLDGGNGDKIEAEGNGNIVLNIPAEGEMKMHGSYIIQQGKYDFTFHHLQILNYNREFMIDANSSIKWSGSLTNADVNVTAHTAVKARLYDLISDEVNRLNLSKQEIHDAQVRQNINVLLDMKGTLNEPKMNFKIQPEEGRSYGTYAYQKLQRINTDEKQTLIQVSSLLLLGQFVPPEGLNSSAVSSGTINNMSEIFSSAASAQITNFANRALGMKDFSVGVKYKNYALNNSNQANQTNFLNRNEAKVNLSKNFLNDRLVIEVGGVYDWGEQGIGGNYSSNLAGDFKIQYLLSRDGRVRFSIFRTSDYDPLFSLRTVAREGVRLSYRKSFNNLKDFFTTRKFKPTNIKMIKKSLSDSTKSPIYKGQNK